MDNNAGLAFLFFVFIIIIIWFFSMSGSVRERNIIYRENFSCDNDDPELKNCNNAKKEINTFCEKYASKTNIEDCKKKFTKQTGNCLNFNPEYQKNSGTANRFTSCVTQCQPNSYYYNCINKKTDCDKKHQKDYRKLNPNPEPYCIES